MASAVDFRKLREQTMDRGTDEAVTVNTRALIDKVLARYSADWTTLRELIQNAADAAATKVTVRYETLPSISVAAPNQTVDEGPGSSPSEPRLSMVLKHVVKNHTVGRLIVSNDGQPFGTHDWSRLRRIAEGNPDETKIGAFGVGFYSVFADCEEPFVVSGKETMAFYWKGNSLYTRSGALPDGQSEDTSFILDYRTTSPVPDLFSVSQFLATSLTFVGLERIELWLDEWRILSLGKITDPGRSLSIPRNINTKTSDHLMVVQSVTQTTAQIKAEWIDIIGWKPNAEMQTTARALGEYAPSTQLKSFFSRLTIGSSTAGAKKANGPKSKRVTDVLDVSSTARSVVFLRVSTVNVQTRISPTSSKELERATKKPPPKQTTISILASPHDAPSTASGDGTGTMTGSDVDVFGAVLPSQRGRIFIGFPTAQTTGFLCHVSAPGVIPTVERESIDLNARYVRDWNSGLLRAAGVASRIVFEGEMASVKVTLQRTLADTGRNRPSDAAMESIVPATAHILKQHTPHESTPSATVGSIIESAFWECSKVPSMEVLSNQGVLPSDKVRIVSEDLSFLDNTPIVPSQLMSQAEQFIQKMFERGLLSSMTVEDIKRDLDTKALSQGQLTEFLKWAIAKIAKGLLTMDAIRPLLDVTVATVGGDGTGRLLQLSDVKYFVNVSKIPKGFPVPPETVPFEVTQALSCADLERLGWQQLQIVPWLRHLCEGRKASPGSPLDLTSSPDFAAKVLQVLSKQWDSISEGSKTTVVEMLAPLTVVPTRMGMRKPGEAYFSNVKLFDDLPVIVAALGLKERFLKALGVRKTVELSVVFDRLMTASAGNSQQSGPEWSHVDLVRYLVSVNADIPAKDIIRLRETPICPAEAGGDDDASRVYKVSELFEPTVANRMLRLRTLRWPGEYRPRSDEGRFLSTLGLKSHPSAPEIADVMTQAASRGDRSLYESALVHYVSRYQIDGHSTFDTRAMRSWPILPVEGQEFPQLYPASSVYANPKASVLGFRILRTDLQNHADKFGVERDPSIQGCLELVMEHPPKDSSEARAVFGYLATRIVEVDHKLAERAGNAKIVPIGPAREARPTQRQTHAGSYASPRMCFLGDPSTWGAIVTFVDFGEDANSFLLKVGSKHEPSSLELAGMIVDDPVLSLKALGQDRYLALLRKLAESKGTIKADRSLWKRLRTTACLLGYAEVSGESTYANEKVMSDDFYDDDDESTIKEWSLRAPPQLVIVDTIEDFAKFRKELVVAPDERSLEDLYSALGTPMLSSIVEVQQYIGPASGDQSEAQTLRRLLVERSRLFVHNYGPENILHDTRWIEKNLTVRRTPSISVRKSLKGYRATKSEQKTAALTGGKSPVLSVTSRCDLYEVSREIVHLLLKRPKQHDLLALLSILESKLSVLRARGYNVDRILRRREHESRLAEEQHRKIRDEQLSQPRTPTNVEEKPKAGHDPQDTGMNHRVPGAFDDSPDQPSQPGLGNFLNNIRKQVGLGDATRPEATSPTPGPRSLGRPTTSASPPAPELSSSFDQVSRDLRSALSSCRPYDSTTLKSQIDTSVVQQAADSYCDADQYKDLEDTGLRVAGLKYFVPTALRSEMPSVVLDVSSSRAHFFFGNMLKAVGGVFGVPENTLHLYDDPSGRTIAFNYGGAIFCNFKFFRNLHLSLLASGVSQTEVTKAWAFWFTTVAHELAHNLVGPHGSQHAFYTESFITEFMPKYIQTVALPPML